MQCLVAQTQRHSKNFLGARHSQKWDRNRLGYHLILGLLIWEMPLMNPWGPCPALHISLAFLPSHLSVGQDRFFNSKKKKKVANAFMWGNILEWGVFRKDAPLSAPPWVGSLRTSKAKPTASTFIYLPQKRWSLLVMSALGLVVKRSEPDDDDDDDKILMSFLITMEVFTQVKERVRERESPPMGPTELGIS